MYYIDLHQINALQLSQSIRKQENIMSTYFFHSKRSRSHSRFFYLILCTVLVCPMLLFTGCQNTTGTSTATEKEPISISSIKLNTAIQITIYDSQDKSLLDDCLALMSIGVVRCGTRASEKILGEAKEREEAGTLYLSI